MASLSSNTEGLQRCRGRHDRGPHLRDSFNVLCSGEKHPYTGLLPLTSANKVTCKAQPRPSTSKPIRLHPAGLGKRGHVGGTADTSSLPSSFTGVEMQKLHGPACGTAARGDPRQKLHAGSTTSGSKFQSQIRRSPGTILKKKKKRASSAAVVASYALFHVCFSGIACIARCSLISLADFSGFFPILE